MRGIVIGCRAARDGGPSFENYLIAYRGEDGGFVFNAEEFLVFDAGELELERAEEAL
jgi:hypothetical protein